MPPSTREPPGVCAGQEPPSARATVEPPRGSRANREPLRARARTSSPRARGPRRSPPPERALRPHRVGARRAPRGRGGPPRPADDGPALRPGSRDDGPPRALRPPARPRARAGWILTLAHGSRITSVPVTDGRACVSRVEQQAAIQAFTWPEGTYSFEAKEVAAGGLRSRRRRWRASWSRGSACSGRSFTTEGMESVRSGAGFPIRAPVVRAGATRTVGRLRLTAGELRLVEKGFDGIETGRSLLRGGLGKHTTLEALPRARAVRARRLGRPKKVRGGAGRPPRSPWRTPRGRSAAGNHFEALGVHWSASSAEIDEAHRAFVPAEARAGGGLGPRGAGGLRADARSGGGGPRGARGSGGPRRPPARRLPARLRVHRGPGRSAGEQPLDAGGRRRGAEFQRSLAKELAQTAGANAGRKISMATLLKAVTAKPRAGGGGGGEGG